jgi:hypothetical protein
MLQTMDRLKIIILLGVLMLSSCESKVYYKYDYVRMSLSSKHYSSRVFLSEEDISKCNYIELTGLDSLHSLNIFNHNIWDCNNSDNNACMEGGLVFKQDTSLCDTLYINDDILVVEFHDFQYNFNSGNVTRDTVIRYKMSTGAIHGIYSFDYETKLFLGWDVYLGDNIIKYTWVVNESCIDAEKFDEFSIDHNLQ